MIPLSGVIPIIVLIFSGVLFDAGVTTRDVQYLLHLYNDVKGLARVHSELDIRTLSIRHLGKRDL